MACLPFGLLVTLVWFGSAHAENLLLYKHPHQALREALEKNLGFAQPFDFKIHSNNNDDISRLIRPFPSNIFAETNFTSKVELKKWLMRTLADADDDLTTKCGHQFRHVLENIGTTGKTLWAAKGRCLGPRLRIKSSLIVYRYTNK